jgi:hypothetical protein
MSEQTYEFEATCEATVRETWRATVPGDLAGEELVDRITDELSAGRCEFISEKAEEEREREVQEHTIEEAAPELEPAYTVTGCSNSDVVKPYTVTVRTNKGPEAALTLAHAAYAEGGGEGELQVIAVFAGEVRLIDFDEPKTWPK